MSLSVEQRRVVYSGNSSTTVFAIPFTFQGNSAYVKAILFDADGTQHAQTISTHYTISGSNLTMLSAPATGKKLVIYSLVPYSQGKLLFDQNPLLPSVVEDSLDILTEQAQQIDEMAQRAIKLDRSTSGAGPEMAALTANATLCVDSTGVKIIMGDSIASVSTNAAAAAASAAAALVSQNAAAASATAAASSATSAASSATAAAASAAALGTPDQVVLTGTFSGGDTTYTLPHTPVAAKGVLAILGVVPQAQGTDYTIAGAVITFTGQDTTTSTLLVLYRF